MATPKEERLNALKKEIAKTRQQIVRKKRKNKTFEARAALDHLRHAIIAANKGDATEARRELDAAELFLR